MAEDGRSLGLCRCGLNLPLRCCLESDWPRMAEAWGCALGPILPHCEGLLEAALAEL